MLSGYYTNYQASVIYAHHRAFGSPGGKLRREGMIAGTNVFFFEQLLESQVVHELAPNFSTNNRRCRGNKKQVWFQSSYTSLSVTLLPEVNGVALEKRTKFLIGVLRRWAGLRGRFLYTQQMINFWKTKDLDSSKREVTHHTQRILNKIVNRLVITSSAGQKAVGQYVQSCKRNKTINWGSHIPQNCSSKAREKWRHSEINKNWGSSLPWDPPCKKW